MADSTNNVGIKDSWSLMSFARQHGKLKLAPFINKETGESFNSLAFVDADRKVTLVAFSSKLGELSPAQIVAQKDELQVVQLESGTYKLCKMGDGLWQDIDLGL